MKFISRLLTSTLLAGSLIVAAHSASAQGTAFTYQGKLGNGTSPANGTFDFRFKLYSDSLGTTQIGSSFLTNAIFVTNGLFTLPIDFGTGLFTGSNCWLEVAVKTNAGPSYTVLAPLQAVTPTPYAVFANTASNLSGSLPVSKLSGTIAGANLPSSPNFSGTVSATSFSGDGANVTNVNAASLGGLNSSNFWKLGGNNVAAGQTFGSTNTQAVDFISAGVRSLRLDASAISAQASALGYTNLNGAPNVIGGSPGNYVAPGSVGVVIGGGGTTNYGGGAITNSVYGDFGTISGGVGNTIEPALSLESGATIGGGELNRIKTNSALAVIAGGVQNVVQTNSRGAVISGGGLNTNGAFFGVIGGGAYNSVTGTNGTVGGGWDNQVKSNYATIPGGMSNIASGTYSFAAGYQAQALHDGAFVWSDSQGSAFSSTNNNSFNVRAGGGIRLLTGGAGMTLDGVSIYNGSALTNLNASQLTSGTLPTNVLPGFQPPYYDVIGGGFSNSVGTFGGDVIAGGVNNKATGGSSTVSGGVFNTASGIDSVIGGGWGNQATNYYSTIPGGYSNLVTGAYGFAAGRQAQAVHDGTFVWSDSINANFTSTRSNQFLVRAGGGVGINTNNPQATLDVNGSLRVNSGTVFTNVLAGQGIMAGGSSTSYTNLTITFSKTFLTVPKVLTTVNADPGWDVPDTFVSSVRKVTTTNCVINILRVDSATGWSQNLRINWMAWE